MYTIFPAFPIVWLIGTPMRESAGCWLEVTLPDKVALGTWISQSDPVEEVRLEKAREGVLKQEVIRKLLLLKTGHAKLNVFYQYYLFSLITNLNKFSTLMKTVLMEKLDVQVNFLRSIGSQLGGI